MFKKYVFNYGEGHSVDFFVHSKGTRNGFMHRACVIGVLPRLDDMGKDWSQYRDNEDKLFGKRVVKVGYANRTWESWDGQSCLQKLWAQLDELKFVDMSQIAKVCPFDSSEEPAHEDLFEPDELFDRFKRRC